MVNGYGLLALPMLAAVRFIVIEAYDRSMLNWFFKVEAGTRGRFLGIETH